MGFKKYADQENMIAKNAQGQWEFTKGKYKGYTIDEVVAEDRGYAGWAHREAYASIADEPYFKLGDALERAGVETGPKRGRK